MKKNMSFTPLFAAALVALCTADSLSGYVAPVFEPIEVLAEEEGKEEVRKEISEEEAIEEIIQGNFELEDGIYEGIGTGFAGKIKVAVEIKDRSIIAIEILDSGAEDTSFFNRAKGVIDKMIAFQSLDVDVISGATYSSNGIIAAVKNALTGEVDRSETVKLPTGQGSTTVGKVEEASAYKDGIYYGSGTGFGGTTTVKVVISGGKIASITIQSTNDGSSYIQSASAVISRIIAGQTTNVDTVSGATYSSVGIIQAVRNALSQAAVDQTVDTENEDSNKDEEEEITIVEGLFPYMDGVYYGTGEGYVSDIKVAVEIQGKTIRSVSIVEHGDDEAFMGRAVNILDTVVANQTTEVDVVSGATYSSKGILEAIQNALAEAERVTNGESEEESDKSEPDDTKEEETEGDTDDSGEKEEKPSGLYQDGEYTWTILCIPDEYEDFEAYNLSLTITMKDDKIIEMKDITGDGGEDNERYIGWAANGRGSAPGIVTQILETGMLVPEEIDVVSRATCTSNALIEACQNILEQARIIEVPEESEPEEDEETADTALYYDGEYEANALCIPDEYEDFEAYHLSLKIKVENDKIVAITDVAGDGGEDNERYISWAANGRGSASGIVTQILEAGILVPEEIDIVSRATCSSQAIVEACQKALEQAKVMTEEVQ